MQVSDSQATLLHLRTAWLWLHPDGSVVDGRNRYNACEELGIEPAYRTWDGEGSLVDFVVSLNLKRWHLPNNAPYQFSNLKLFSTNYAKPENNHCEHHQDNPKFIRIVTARF